MKLLLLAALALPLAAAVQEDASAPSKDRAAVERAIQDYVEGFYHAKPELLERGVSKDLKKMGYWRKDADAPYSDAMHMTFDQAIALAKSWNANGEQGDDLTYDIEIYEVADKTACGKLTAKWGIDYFQLVKEKDDAWKIHHVLWQSHPPKATKEAGSAIR
ncbi:MAG: nuclear transport factor 2 family protein [Planctomycetota bacterium]